MRARALSAPALCRPAAPRRCPARTGRENKQCTLEAIGGKVAPDVKTGGRTAVAVGRGHRMLRRNRLHNPLVSRSDAKPRVSNNDPVGAAIGSRRSVLRVASPAAPLPVHNEARENAKADALKLLNQFKQPAAVIARSEATKQSMPPPRPVAWIASPSARNDGGGIRRTDFAECPTEITDLPGCRPARPVGPRLPPGKVAPSA